MSEFQSTPLMRGETFTVENSYLGLSISIHSPHARGDRRAGEACRMRTSFQSTPLTRGETKSQSFTIRAPRFQSTPLTRGETRHAPRIAHCSTHFNPLPSREGRRPAQRHAHSVCVFQSTPLTRGETIHGRDSKNQATYQSTPLTRGETQLEQYQVCRYQNFNPLPSREGRRDRHPKCSDRENFNPLPSREGRRQGGRFHPRLYTFQSTPLTRGETRRWRRFSPNRAISIHSPHARGDLTGRFFPSGGKEFQSTPLTRGETA